MRVLSSIFFVAAIAALTASADAQFRRTFGNAAVGGIVTADAIAECTPTSARLVLRGEVRANVLGARREVASFDATVDAGNATRMQRARLELTLGPTVIFRRDASRSVNHRFNNRYVAIRESGAAGGSGYFAFLSIEAGVLISSGLSMTFANGPGASGFINQALYGYAFQYVRSTYFTVSVSQLIELGRQGFEAGVRVCPPGTSSNVVTGTVDHVMREMRAVVRLNIAIRIWSFISWVISEVAVWQTPLERTRLL